MTITHNNETDLHRLARESGALANSLERVACGLAPTQADLASAPILDQWSIVARPAPALAGSVTGHPLRGNLEDLPVPGRLFWIVVAPRLAATEGKRP